MYNWRKMTDEQRDEALSRRKGQNFSWHGPPSGLDQNWYHVAAACYDHKHIIGYNQKRMVDFEQELLFEIAPVCNKISAWSILPNHYHLLVQTPEIEAVKKVLGHLHGHTSFLWNRENGCTGRKCWHRCLPKQIKSHRHRMATMNYIHHNPVHHGYADRWQSWPFTSAQRFLDTIEYEQAVRIWMEYPIDKIGENWDSAEM